MCSKNVHFNEELKKAFKVCKSLECGFVNLTSDLSNIFLNPSSGKDGLNFFTSLTGSRFIHLIYGLSPGRKKNLKKDDHQSRLVRQ